MHLWFKELKGEHGYQSGKNDAKYVNGYDFTSSKMGKDYLCFSEQVKSLQGESLGPKRMKAGARFMVTKTTDGLKSGL
jgi:hypothetical protein